MSQMYENYSYVLPHPIPFFLLVVPGLSNWIETYVFYANFSLSLTCTFISFALSVHKFAKIAHMDLSIHIFFG